MHHVQAVSGQLFFATAVAIGRTTVDVEIQGARQTVTRGTYLGQGDDGALLVDPAREIDTAQLGFVRNRQDLCFAKHGAVTFVKIGLRSVEAVAPA